LAAVFEESGYKKALSAANPQSRNAALRCLAVLPAIARSLSKKTSPERFAFRISDKLNYS
jgi:hypothetical protein